MRFFRRVSWVWPLLSKFFHFICWNSCLFVTRALDTKPDTEVIGKSLCSVFWGKGWAPFPFCFWFCQHLRRPPKHTCLDCLGEGEGVFLGPDKCFTFSSKQNPCQILVQCILRLTTIAFILAYYTGNSIVVVITWPTGWGALTSRENIWSGHLPLEEFRALGAGYQDSLEDYIS